MLIEFRVQNFRSFREPATFSMVAGTYVEYADSNTFASGLKSFDRLLASAAIYGPNAAGKTNLLRAIQFMQNLVVNSASTTTQYPYSPFLFSAKTRSEPSEFQVSIIHDGVRYEYGFTMGAERFEKEWLIDYPRGRERKLFTRNYVSRRANYQWSFSEQLRGQKISWSETTREKALFLPTAVQLNSTQLLPVFEWFQKRLVVVSLPGPTQLNQGLTIKLLEQPKGKETLLPFLQQADLGIADLTVDRQPLPSGAMVLKPTMLVADVPGNPLDAVIVTLSHETDNPKKPQELPFDEESQGTQSLFRTAGAFINVLTNGEVLLVDEIDRSLHPLLVRFLIQKFHSRASNPKNAQLIFTTHNTSLLERDLLRRDQLWFVEKKRDGSSGLYPLSDFSPRKDESIERGYLRGRFGALPILPPLED
jgi:uncharacterized protein